MSEILFRVRDGILTGEYENGVIADFGDYRCPRKAVLAPIPGSVHCIAQNGDVIPELQVCTIDDEMWEELQKAYRATDQLSEGQK